MIARQAHFCECGDHAFTPVTRGFVVLVSPEHAPLLNKKWGAIRAGKTSKVMYASRSEPTEDGAAYKTVLLHRLIFTEDSLCDHRSRDGLDNRNGNLRAATHSQNMANALRSRSASGYRGVIPRGKRYIAILTTGPGKQKYLGTFDDPVEAAKVFDEAAFLLRGDFAILNFPKGAA